MPPARIKFELITPRTPEEPLSHTHQAIEQWSYAREMFRRLGFAAADLYLSVDTVTDDNDVAIPNMTAIGVTLRTQGKEVEWVIGWLHEEPYRVAAFYEELATLYRTKPEYFNLDAFFASWAFSKRWELMAELEMLGFQYPRKIN